MIAENTCPKCRCSYEVVWDDYAAEDYSYRDDDYSSDSFSEDTPEYPEFCPFCGVSRTYGGEEDAYDDSLDD